MLHFWVTAKSSGGFLLGRDFDSVAERYTADDLRQLILSLQRSPAFRRSHYELENHEARGVLRERALHANRIMPMPHNALASVRQLEIDVRDKEVRKFSLHRLLNQPFRAGAQNFRERVVDFVFLAEGKNFILGYGLTLLV